MLILARAEGEAINLYVKGVRIASVTLTEIVSGRKVRLGITAGKEVEIHRQEIDPYRAVAPPRVVRSTTGGEGK
jgi:sRNA-binding carbon storage regulator CsrA